MGEARRSTACDVSNPAQFTSANNLGEREETQTGEEIGQSQMAFTL